MGEASLSTWIPDVATIYQDITFKPDPMQEAEYISVKDFKGMDFDWRPSDGHWSEFIVKWPAWTANNWTIPLVSVAAYFMLIPFLRWYVGKYGKWDVRNVAFYFLLFFKLFIENYVTQTRKAPAKGLPPKQKSIAAVTRTLSRKITNQMMPQVEDEGEGDGGDQQKGQDKKIN